MSKLKEHAVRSASEHAKHSGKAVVNFMGGTSYEVNPIDNLKMISASSIFGEKSYYRDGIKTKTQPMSQNMEELPAYKTSDIFEKAIDAALSFDFQATLNLAFELRKEYYMRFNPAVIFMRAAMHPDREKFNNSNPGVMKSIGKKIAMRPDDITNQFEYYMYINKTKNKLPGIIKRTWAERLGEFNRYQISKYQTSGMIRDLVRISHAHSPVISELMKCDGVLPLDETETTWERLRANGESWKDIFVTIDMPHMALLRNLRGIFTEVNDIGFVRTIISHLKAGVEKGQQFPFRYYTASQAILGCNHAGILKDGLNDCLDLAMSNFPKLKGKVMCLSDNSGSAWHALTTEYGSTTVADIDNLSSIMTAYNADEGYIGYFGDRLEIAPISKRDGVLSQKESLDRIYGGVDRREGTKYVGGGTENGIWIFFRDAIKNLDFYDTIFIYSDQQAGHGYLYGTDAGKREYKNYTTRGEYIDVMKLALEYRAKVNPKVNLFSVQTAGYDNSVLPENSYRTCILTGWTGKEAVYAQRMIQIWDEIEAKQQ